MPARFGLVGTGWRGEFYLRVARACSERFVCAGIVPHSPEKNTQLFEKWKTPVYPDYAELLRAEKPDFLVIAVPGAAARSLIAQIGPLGIPALVETFWPDTFEGLKTLYESAGKNHRIQIAEQYRLQPMQQARLAIASSGLLGRVFEAQVSVSQCYHGISVMRRILGVLFEDCQVTGKVFMGRLQRGGNRKGDPDTDEITDDKQTLGWFDFGGRLGVFDNSAGQLRSWARTQRTDILGETGCVTGSEVRWLQNYLTPMEDTLRRVEIGREESIEGAGLRGVSACGRYFYKNPYLNRLYMDDEIAVAHQLDEMAAFACGGAPGYSLAEGLQDQYLSLLMYRSAEEGKPIQTEKQIWAGKNI